MSLKNRNETKLLMENWRKVLKEGLYDSDPELLEEGLGEKALFALVTSAASLGPTIAQAKIPGESPKEQLRAQAGILDSFLNDESLELADKQSLVQLLAKIQSPNIEQLSSDEMVKYEKFKSETADKLKHQFEKYKEIKEKLPKAKKALSDAIAGAESIGGGDEMEIAQAKANLESLIREAEFCSKYIHDLMSQAKNYSAKHSEDGGVVRTNLTGPDGKLKFDYKGGLKKFGDSELDDLMGN